MWGEEGNAHFDMAIVAAQLRNDDRNYEEDNNGFKNDLAAILFVVQRNGWPLAVYVDLGVNFQSVLRRHAW